MISDATLRTLEWDKVLDRLQAYASFSAGKEAVLGLRPAVDLGSARARLDQTSEGRRLLADHPAVHLGGAHDVRPAARKAEVGSVLTPSELLDIGSTLRAADRVRRAVLPDDNLPWLRSRAECMWHDRTLQSDLDSTFSERGEVLDSASAQLRRIRGDIVTAQGRLMDRLNSMISSTEQRAHLQEAIITVRNGRYVVPVRADARSRVPGIVHDQSSSGQTIFVEPMAAVEMNNRLRELQLAEEREIERILQALSTRIGERAPEVTATVEALRDVDLALARAKYADALEASPPALNDDGHLELVSARHPLLPRDAVPISVQLGDEFRVLVITGPNTGGKTVSLKTVGLLTLMAQGGMHIPAAAESRVAVFPAVMADIGDEQSIEQSLSTFSSHMRNIIEMLPEINDRSLVLLDELGAGTDPAEGAALAKAILTTLLDSGARAVVTTHYSELKTFAHEETGVENASVEFDVETLSPTYRLTTGLPGRSQALAIAQRLGMPQRVLSLARNNISEGAVRVEQLLSQIQSERQEIGRLFSRARELHGDARKLRGRVRSELTQVERSRERILSQARDEGAAAVRELRIRLREIEEEAHGTVSRREGRELRAKVEEVQDQAVAALGLPGPQLADAPTLQPIRPGAAVNVLSLDQEGNVLTVDGGEAEVQVGLFKMRVPVDDLQALSRQERSAARSVEFQSTRDAPAMEIDVRGWRADDAVRELDQYLHDNYMHGQHTVRIVHGKGTGALRKAIREQLSGHPLVKSHAAEKPQGGGEGVTVVTLAL